MEDLMNQMTAMEVSKARTGYPYTPESSLRDAKKSLADATAYLNSLGTYDRHLMDSAVAWVKAAQSWVEFSEGWAEQEKQERDYLA